MLRKLPMPSILTLKSFPNIAFETVPMLVLWTMAPSHPFMENCHSSVHAFLFYLTWKRGKTSLQMAAFWWRLVSRMQGSWERLDKSFPSLRIL